MKVYIESNFVLELALMQEQHESCEKILSLCETGTINLVLPAFCVAEPYETLVRRAKHRSKLAKDVADELKQLSRSTPYKDSEEINALQNVTGLLVRSGEEEEQKLQQTLNRILKVAEIIPLEAEILTFSAKFPGNPQACSTRFHHLCFCFSASDCFKIKRNILLSQQKF